MPTTRRKVTRTRQGGSAEIESAAQYFLFGYLLNAATWGTGKTEKELRSFWKANRAAIMTAASARCERINKPFQRPFPFWDWEKREPRKRIAWEKWTGPQCGPVPRINHRDPVYESDEEYLTRQGLLFDWEKQIIKTRGNNDDTAK